MFYLAAAVSDFYIPASEMPEHKIQSSNGPLQVGEKTFKTFFQIPALQESRLKG